MKEKKKRLTITMIYAIKFSSGQAKKVITALLIIIYKNMENNLQILDCDLEIESVQKVCLLGTARTLKKYWI